MAAIGGELVTLSEASQRGVSSQILGLGYVMTRVACAENILRTRVQAWYLTRACGTVSVDGTKKQKCYTIGRDGVEGGEEGTGGGGGVLFTIHTYA